MPNVLTSFLKIILFLPIFLFLATLIFYSPGFLLTQKIKKRLRDDEVVILSFSLGMIIFLTVAILTALLKVRLFSPIVFLLINLWVLKKFGLKAFLPLLGLVKQKILMAFILLGTLVEGFINFPSSFPFRQGHLYWSSQGHDGLWHIAVIEQIKQNFPPDNPLWAGEKLFNYHFFSDTIMAEFGRFFPFFSTLDLYFRHFSFLIAFLMGLSAYCFLTTWKNKKVGLLGIFFTYFVGSFGYIVLAIQGRGFFGGETIFWAAQGNTIIGNPPHAFCFILLPTFFLAFYYYLKEKNLTFFWFSALLGAFLVGFKVSAAVVLLVGMGASSLFSYLLTKRKDLLSLTGLLGFVNLIIFKLITRQGESFLLFQPWWFIRTMIVVPDRVNWMDLELRRQFYLARGGIRGFLRVIQFETLAFLIFLIGNLGTRIIGFAEIAKIFLKRTVFQAPLATSLFFAMLTGFLVPLFFIQKGVVYNLIQFMQYFLLLFGFWAAISLYHFCRRFKTKKAKVIFWAAFIFLSVPTVIGNLVEFYGKNALAVVTYKEIEALDFLKVKTSKSDIVLTRPFNPYSRGLYKSQPWPIYAWESTAYISAYTGRQTYYTDEGQMRILGMETEERLNSMRQFFEEKTTLEQKKEFLENEKISFLYLRAEELIPEQVKDYPLMGFREVFRNDEVVIFQLEEQKS